MIDNLGNEEIGHLPSAIIINQQAFFSSHPETAESSMLLPLRRGPAAKRQGVAHTFRSNRLFVQSPLWTLAVCRFPASRSELSSRSLARAIIARTPAGPCFEASSRGLARIV